MEKWNLEYRAMKVVKWYLNKWIIRKFNIPLALDRSEVLVQFKGYIFDLGTRRGNL